MDLAFDPVLTQPQTPRSTTPTPTSQNTAHPPDDPSTPRAQRQNLQTEFQETFQAFSNSQWGAKLGGWWSSTQKQGKEVYDEAVKEAEDLKKEGLKGWSGLREGLVGRVRGLSLEGAEQPRVEADGEGGEKRDVERAAEEGGDREAEKKVEDTEGFLERFKAEAAKRLKDVQKAEDAADEALLRFGTNVRNFLKEAVSVSAPEDERQGGGILFESKDAATGKRTIHASRLDAQLYVIHTNEAGLMTDPEGVEWDGFKKEFDVALETERIAKDLEQYTELRKTMERLVPERAEYGQFWTRYYFLRRAVEAREEKRKELLKASANETEEVGWDDEEDEEEHKASTPLKSPLGHAANESSTTINQIPASSEGLRPEGRRSHDEKSVADSEASYDMVSGAPSHAASSPKEKKVDESDEEDWE